MFIAFRGIAARRAVRFRSVCMKQCNKFKTFSLIRFALAARGGTEECVCVDVRSASFHVSFLRHYYFCSFLSAPLLQPFPISMHRATFNEIVLSFRAVPVPMTGRVLPIGHNAPLAAGFTTYSTLIHCKRH